MNSLFPHQQFAGFGPNRLDPAPDPSRFFWVHSPRLTGLRARVRLECPRRAGVYGMVDPNGELIYVGKAKNLRVRLLSYFRARSRDPKAGHILAQTRGIAWELQPSEFAALLRELQLIRRWQPRCNVQGRPGRRLYRYVCLGRRPAPYVFLAPKPTSSAQVCYGPVPAGRTVRDAARRLNDLFGLRDCPQSQEMVFAEQGELFPQVRPPGCLRFDIGTCVGPCTGRCSRAAYWERVHSAEHFLAGEDVSILEHLERDMAGAAEAMQFERAAALRDKWEAVAWLHLHLRRLEEAQRHSFIYPVKGQVGKDVWYVIREGRVLAALSVPSNAAGRNEAARLLETAYQQKRGPFRMLAVEEVDLVLLVAAWFRRYPEQRERILSPERALEWCREHRD